MAGWELVEYSAAALGELIAESSGEALAGFNASVHAAYFAEYFAELKAKTVLVEVWHDADGADCESGASVWPLYTFPALACAVYTGSTDFALGDTHNRATRITNSRLGLINAWISGNSSLGEVIGNNGLWVGLSGFVHAPPVATAHSGVYFDLYVTDAPTNTQTVGRRIKHKILTSGGYSPSITGWHDLGPGLPNTGVVNSPASVTRWSGFPANVYYKELFYTGTNGHVYHKVWNGSAWVPGQLTWTDITGTQVKIVSQPTVVSTNGKLFVFGVSDQGQVWSTRKTSAQFQPWEYIGGITTPYHQTWVAAVSRQADTIDLFIRDGASGQVRNKSWANGWLPSQTGWWTSLAGNIREAPTVVAPLQNRLDVFARDAGTTNQIISKTWTQASGWTPLWRVLGGTTTAPIAAISRSAGLIDLFIRDTAGAVQSKAWTGAAWVPSETGWWFFGTDFTSVAATTSSASRIELFARDSLTGGIRYRWWDGTRWWF
jgi:hypothetical protein